MRCFLIITYMDRLYRQPIELEHIIPEIEKAGVLIATVYEGDMDLRTDTGQLQGRVKVAFARAEVMRKANRREQADLELPRTGTGPLTASAAWLPGWPGCAPGR